MKKLNRDRGIPVKVLLTTLNAKYIHSSLALRYLEKYCRHEDYEIRIEEYTINDRLDAITANIYKTGADVIAFSCYIWNITMTLEIADRLKKVKPDCIIILGGAEVSYDAATILDSHAFIDYLMMGEGEETFKELLAYINTRRPPLGSIRGIAYRAGQTITVNEERSLICDLDRIPSPYHAEDLKALVGKLIYYETSRGCPFNCSYCLSSTTRSVRYFSMERVKADLLFLIENSVKLVKFVDRTFNADKKRTMALFEFLVQNRQKTSFHFEIAADLLDDEMIAYLARVPEGLFQFEIGVQSTNLNTIRAIRRKMNFNKVAENVKKLGQAGNMHLHLDLIAGLPGEDYRSFARSFDDVYGLAPHALQLGFLKLLKGSVIRKQALRYDYKYTALPPYEVLQNNTMSYTEILRLKGIEDVLEKYHNSGVFEKSLGYVLRSFYPSPFRFFEDLAAYFEEQGLDKRSHSRKALYDILFEFYDRAIGREAGVFTQYLKFDLLHHQKGVQLPYWAKKADMPRFQEKCFEFLKKEENIQILLPQYLGMPAKKVIKQVGFEVFDINVLAGDAACKQGEKTVVLFDYDRRKAYDITEKVLCDCRH